MSNLEKAARMALEGLERSESALHKARAAIREALAEQPAQQQCKCGFEAYNCSNCEQPAQGCNYCNHPLYAGTSCKNCGRVTEQTAIKQDLTPEQPAQQQTSLDQAVEQSFANVALQTAQKQEPVACPYCKNSATLGVVYFDQNCAECVKRMTSPPASKPWVGLTDEEIKRMAAPLFMSHYWNLCNEFARAIEAMLKEKNT